MSLPIKIYMSGPIKDNDDFKEDFAYAKSYLKKSFFGAEIINPADLPEGLAYGDYMRRDLRDLVDCHIIYMLEGWDRSAGARCEHLVAVSCEMPILYENKLI